MLYVCNASRGLSSFAAVTGWSYFTSPWDFAHGISLHLVSVAGHRRREATPLEKTTDLDNTIASLWLLSVCSLINVVHTEDAHTEEKSRNHELDNT